VAQSIGACNGETALLIEAGMVRLRKVGQSAALLAVLCCKSYYSAYRIQELREDDKRGEEATSNTTHQWFVFHDSIPAQRSATGMSAFHV
jgi:hypothetical protein